MKNKTVLKEVTIKTSRFKGKKSLQVGIVHIVKVGIDAYKTYIHGREEYLSYWAGYNLKQVLNDFLKEDIIEF